MSDMQTKCDDEVRMLKRDIAGLRKGFEVQNAITKTPCKGRKPKRKQPATPPCRRRSKE
jgi:hypothetical protein